VIRRVKEILESWRRKAESEAAVVPTEARRRAAHLRIRTILESYSAWTARTGLAASERLEVAEDSEDVSLELRRLADVVDRYTLPWIVRIENTTFPPPHYRPLIHDHPQQPAFPTNLDHIYAIPLLYRLAFLRQLSLVSVTTHFEAGHSRLTHVLGVARIANRMLLAINGSESAQSARENSNDRVHRAACLLYAFIHDVFHGPMGHTLDIMKDIFQADLREKLDDYFFRTALNSAIDGSDDPIGTQLFDAADACLPGDAKEVLKKIDLISRTVRLDTEAPELWFLRDIVDSQLDADRLDYIARDSLVLLGGAEDYTRIIDSARAFEIGNSEAGGSRRSAPVHLAFHERHEPDIARILGARRRLYLEFYEAPAKLIADNMLCHAIFYILGNKQLLGARRGAEEEVRRHILNRFLLLTDDELFSALAELQAAPHCYELLIRLRQHRYYKQIYSKGLVAKHEEAVDTELSAWWGKVNERKKQWGTGDWDSIRRLLANESREHLTEQHLIVAVQRYMRPGFLDRFYIEGLIWEVLRQLDPNGDAQLAYIFNEYGVADFISQEQLREFPPIHFTTTSYIAGVGSRQDAAERQDRLASYEKEHSRPQEVYIYTDDGTCRRRQIPIESQPMLELYPVVLSAPEELCRAFDPANWLDAWSGGSQPASEEAAEVLSTTDASVSGEIVLERAMIAVLRSLKWLHKDSGSNPN
jgi:HD superfamily phosphohydrolase